MTDPKPTSGIMAVIISPTGDIEAAEVSFVSASAMGVENEIVQQRDASSRAAVAMIRNHCSGTLAEAILRKGYIVDRVVDSLREMGWRFDKREVEVSGDD